MWTAVEDYIVEHWCSFLQRWKPTHLFLHFDGLRVNADIHPNLQELLKLCEAHILDSTGFRVSIAEKKHLLCLDLVSKSASSTEKIDVPEILLQPGNCIPCSLWHILEERNRHVIEECVGDADTPASRYLAERGCRTYAQF